MGSGPDAAGEQEIRFGEAAARDPCADGSARLLRDFELHWPSCFLLYDHRPITNRTGKGNVSDGDGDKVATPQLAVDGEIKQR